MPRSGGCPKCGGSVLPERQMDGSVEFCCLQCGRTLTRQEVVARIGHAAIGLSGSGVAAMTQQRVLSPLEAARAWLAEREGAA